MGKTTDLLHGEEVREKRPDLDQEIFWVAFPDLD